MKCKRNNLGKITTLITTYKRPEYLYRAISSVLNQSYKNLEIHVFDDASGDETENTVQNIMREDDRLQYYCHPINMGMLKNVQSAIASVDTPYFSLLSDDELLTPNMYQDAIEIFNAHPTVMFVILNTISIDDKDNLIGNRESTGNLTVCCGDSRFETWHTSNIPRVITSILFKKELAQIFLNISGIDIGFDIRIMLIAAAKFDYAYLSKVGGIFTHHANSFSAGKSNFNLPHHVIQVSRYTDIFYMQDVSQVIKDSCIYYIRKKLFHNGLAGLYEVLKRSIKNICINEDLDQIGNKEIKDARYSGYRYTALILKYFYFNKVIKAVLRLLFQKYYYKKRFKHQAYMKSLQEGVYKELFEYIKIIGNQSGPIQMQNTSARVKWS